MTDELNISKKFIGKYMPMFDACLKGYKADDLEDVKKEIMVELAWSKEVMAREDRILWYLKLFRQYLIFEQYKRDFEGKMPKEALNDPKLFRELCITKTDADRQITYLKLKGRRNIIAYTNHLFFKYVNKIPAIDREYDEWFTDIRNIKEELRHYLNIHYVKIQDFEFGNKGWYEIYRSFVGLNEEWQKICEERKGRLLAIKSGDRKLIDFEDGWAWWALNRSGCRDEADSMGHCGNGEGREYEQIISLREKDPDTPQWVPHATFIYNKKDKSLGEMKGYKNNKPSDSLHKYILPLVYHDDIQFLQGGGHKPECNFNALDLKKKDIMELISKKPEVVPMDAIYETVGDTNELFRQQLLNRCDSVNVEDADLDDDEHDRFREREDFKLSRLSSETFQFVLDNRPGLMNIVDILEALGEKHETFLTQISKKYYRRNRRIYSDLQTDTIKEIYARNSESLDIGTIHKHFGEDEVFVSEYIKRRERGDDVSDFIEMHHIEDKDIGERMVRSRPDLFNLTEMSIFIEANDPLVKDGMINELGNKDIVSNFDKETDLFYYKRYDNVFDLVHEYGNEEAQIIVDQIGGDNKMLNKHKFKTQEDERGYEIDNLIARLGEETKDALEGIVRNIRGEEYANDTSLGDAIYNSSKNMATGEIFFKFCESIDYGRAIGNEKKMYAEFKSHVEKLWKAGNLRFDDHVDETNFDNIPLYTTPLWIVFDITGAKKRFLSYEGKVKDYGVAIDPIQACLPSRGFIEYDQDSALDDLIENLSEIFTKHGVEIEPTIS